MSGISFACRRAAYCALWRSPTGLRDVARGRYSGAMFDLTLTFDNGPDDDATPLVLDILAKRGIRTTFFVIGQQLAGHRALAERAAAEGHWIGNHTFTHSGPLGTRRDPGLPAREIGNTQELLGSLAHPHRYFRPQGGGGKLGLHLLSDEAADFLERGAYTVVLWNAIPRDWDDPDGWMERALVQCAEQPWTLMVLHDIASGAMRHLDRFLDQVAERGGRLRQDFPPDCVPMTDGIATGGFGRYVSGK
jgi:peptidoglycan/xylan/chitin deacetylase (PgdA/CDA1 family)